MATEHDRIKREKRHRYQQNSYVEGYVDGETVRDVQVVAGDTIISTPIVVEETVVVNSTNYIQTLTPIATTADGDLASNDVISSAPIPDTDVIIILNGIVITPADGSAEVSTSSAWFESPDNVVRAHGEVQLGDSLKWNGSVAGAEIATTDELILIYEVDAL